MELSANTAPRAYDITVTPDVPVQMRDGTLLRADVYRPVGAGRVPVTLCRTPYDKHRAKDVRVAQALARAGYISVVLDIRGRNASDGRWTWHLAAKGSTIESSDGYDSCEWAAGLDGSNGRVGGWGNSYPAWLAWRMAGAQPPSLRTIFASGFPVHTTDCMDGIFQPGIYLRFLYQMAVSERHHHGDTGYPATVADANYVWDRIERGKWLWHTPFDDLPDDLFGAPARMLKDYFRAISHDFWALDAIHGSVAVPTSTLTGWWDRLSGTVDHFSSMRQRGPQRTRAAHRLTIGPWVHDVTGQGDWVGPRDYGVGTTIQYESVLQRWFDHHLREIDTGIGRERPVRLYILNEGWRYADTWPPAGVAPRSLYLRSGGRANTPAGDGRLSADEPGREQPDHFTYDPVDPVMSLADGDDGQVSAADQKPLYRRRDILVYQTDLLADDIVVVGNVECRLWVSSDCPDTDFVARLIEVGADGLAMNLTQGIMRTRYRLGFEQEVMLERGEPTLLTIKMLAAGIRFRRGTRIRLDVTSSDFPLYDRNHNTGQPFFSDRALRVAHQVVYHDPEHRSELVLPVVPQHDSDAILARTSVV